MRLADMDAMDPEVLEWILLARRLREVNKPRFRELLDALGDVVGAEEALARICTSCGNRHRKACA